MIINIPEKYKLEIDKYEEDELTICRNLIQDILEYLYYALSEYEDIKVIYEPDIIKSYESSNTNLFISARSIYKKDQPYNYAVIQYFTNEESINMAGKLALKLKPILNVYIKEEPSKHDIPNIILTLCIGDFSFNRDEFIMFIVYSIISTIDIDDSSDIDITEFADRE